jgi:hypothetical protein
MGEEALMPFTKKPRRATRRLSTWRGQKSSEPQDIFLVDILIVGLFIILLEWVWLNFRSFDRQLTSLEKTQLEFSDSLRDIQKDTINSQVLRKLDHLEREQSLLKNALDRFDMSDEKYLQDSRIAHSREGSQGRQP